VEMRHHMSATETGTVPPSGAIRTSGLLIAGEHAKAGHGRHFHTTEALNRRTRPRG
jgi:benzaldehyde dehydrogenase (NAD)